MVGQKQHLSLYLGLLVAFLRASIDLFTSIDVTSEFRIFCVAIKLFKASKTLYEKLSSKFDNVLPSTKKATFHDVIAFSSNLQIILSIAIEYRNSMSIFIYRNQKRIESISLENSHLTCRI